MLAAAVEHQATARLELQVLGDQVVVVTEALIMALQELRILAAEVVVVLIQDRLEQVVQVAQELLSFLFQQQAIQEQPQVALR